jgi:hypothetical protein
MMETNCRIGVPPSVGIVWGLCVDPGPMVLVTNCTRLDEAEAYGDCLTHSRGHYEVWEAWRRLGPTGLAHRGLPPVILWHEYEHFPRGRVVFETRAQRFVLYADRKLQTPGLLPRVLQCFGLGPARCAVRSDPHYRTSRCP